MDLRFKDIHAAAERLRGNVLLTPCIDLLILSSIIQRGLARGAQLVRLRVETRDVPGELARLSGLIGNAGGNILEVHHQRAFSAHPLQTALVDFVLQTRGRQHLKQMLASLHAAGARASLPDHEWLSTAQPQANGAVG